MVASVSTERAGNLPAELTTFVGRRDEIAGVRRLLSSSRLVSLTGPGGVGKTRLALRVARESQRAFVDGAWLVDLASLEDAGLLAQTVSAALRIKDPSSRWLVASLCDRLADRQLVLVLDNCEHLLDACAVLADALLRAAPGLRILATTRTPLGLSGEAIFPVPPMSAPRADLPLPPAGRLAQYEALRLFAERAAAVQPGFAITDENAAAAARLCQQLEGIPLAIELAVGRLRVLTVEEIVERLDDRFTLLTGGSRVALPRQRTLRALIDWSFQLCSPQERLLWLRLSVFAGGFSLAAAEAVCADDEIGRVAILDVVTGLVDKSVVFAEPAGKRVRYRMLETIRQYGAARLADTPDGIIMRRRHRDYFHEFVARTGQDLFGPGQAAVFARLVAEHDNLRAALQFSASAPAEARRGLLLAADLWHYWHGSGLVGEGRRWLDRLLDLVQDPSRERAVALYVDAWLALLQDDLQAATAALEESRALGMRLGDGSVLGYVALFSGMGALSQGDLATADSLFGEAVARLRAADDVVGTVMALYRRGLVAFCAGDGATTLALCHECRTLCEAHGERWWKAYVLWVLGLQLWREGDIGQAVDFERESIRLNRLFDDRIGIALGLEALAWIAASDGRPEDATRWLGAAGAIWREVGSTLSGFAYLAEFRQACDAAIRQELGERRFEAAYREGESCGLEAAIRSALGDQSASTQAPIRMPEPTGVTLTRRELEIARLVAQGFSNKEIAATLVISPRTAEGHIEHILTKLGFTSRAQVAVWMTRAEPTASDQA